MIYIYRFAHGAYKVVRSLDLEGDLREIPKDTPMAWGHRLLVTAMLLSAMAAALYQALLYRFYQWASATKYAFYVLSIMIAIAMHADILCDNSSG